MLNARRLAALAGALLATAGCAHRGAASTPGEAEVLHVIAGDAGATSARFNVQAPGGGLVEAVLRGEDGEHGAAVVVDPARGHAVLDFEGLSPAAGYTLWIDGEERGATRTLPDDASAPLRLAFVSCFKASQETAAVWIEGERVSVPNHQLWPVLAAEDLDALFLIGDRFYLPNPYEAYDGMSEDEARALFARHHAEMLTIPHVAGLLSRTPTYVIWDDHDFGPNDSASNFHLKHIALEALELTYANPAMGEPGNPGCHFAKSFGPRVDAFFLDDRTHRDCAGRMVEKRDGTQELLCRPEAIVQPDGTYLPEPMLEHCFGPRQMQWLREGLLASTADVKLVIGGGQFLSDNHPWEAWYHFAEREEFLRWLEESRVPGVVFVSGDRHHGEIGRLASRGAYALHEITASGIGVSTFGADEDTPESPYDVLGPVASVHHYGLIEVEPAEGLVRLRLMGMEGELNALELGFGELRP